MNDQPILRLDGLVKRFGPFTALHGIDLTIRDGEFFTIVGPSGSGKSTLIRLLVGMDDATEGAIRLRGERIDHVPANKRPTCMVFQSLALFPHMSVGENIEFPLKLRKDAPDARRARAHELLDLLRLPRDYHGKRIQECSGGERQRVALARALAFDPEILFFDEPLSALDYRLRKTLEKELKDLHARTGKTFVYITHSLEEALVMSDRIAIMRAGRIEQVAAADEIYSAPTSRFVAEFIGEVNLFPATGGPDGLAHSPALTVRGGGALPALDPGAEGWIMVRPEYVSFVAGPDVPGVTLEGTVRADYALGSRVQYDVEAADGRKIIVEKLRDEPRPGGPGTPVTLGFDPARIHMIREG